MGGVQRAAFLRARGGLRGHALLSTAIQQGKQLLPATRRSQGQVCWWWCVAQRRLSAAPLTCEGASACPVAPDGVGARQRQGAGVAGGARGRARGAGGAATGRRASKRHRRGVAKAARCGACTRPKNGACWKRLARAAASPPGASLCPFRKSCTRGRGAPTARSATTGHAATPRAPAHQPLLTVGDGHHRARGEVGARPVHRDRWCDSWRQMLVAVQDIILAEPAEVSAGRDARLERAECLRKRSRQSSRRVGWRAHAGARPAPPCSCRA